MTDFSDLLIITDLDGTFFDAEHKEHKGNCDAAKRFIEKGGLFTIATGRPPAVVGDMLPSYKEICNIPMVTCNGSLFCNPADLSVTEEYPLDKEAAEKVQVIRSGLENGKSFADAVSDTGLFEELHARMIRMGCATGHEDQVLGKLSELYEEQVEEDISRLISIIEPSLVALLTVVIGAVLLSVMLPMAGILSSL